MYLKAPAQPRGVTWGDLVEIAGVYVVLALYVWVGLWLARSRREALSSTTASLPSLLLLAAFTSYALGHGIHVASNSIHDMMGRLEVQDAWGLVHFWDERLGHVLVDAARILFVVGLCWMERGLTGAGAANRHEEHARGVPRPLRAAGAAAYGFIYFASAVEGQTVFLALPFTAALAIWGLREGRRRTAGSRHAPVRAFFTAAALVSLLFFLIWGVWQRGFPEFTRAGIL